MQSRCLCKKYGYDRAKQVMLRTIDQAFSKLEQRFAYKMQKSLAKQIDIDLFGDDVKRQQKLQLNDKSDQYRKEVQEMINKTSQSIFDTKICPTFLDVQSLKNDINTSIAYWQRK